MNTCTTFILKNPPIDITPHLYSKYKEGSPGYEFYFKDPLELCDTNISLFAQYGIAGISAYFKDDKALYLASKVSPEYWIFAKCDNKLNSRYKKTDIPRIYERKLTSFKRVDNDKLENSDFYRLEASWFPYKDYQQYSLAHEKKNY